MTKRRWAVLSTVLLWALAASLAPHCYGGQEDVGRAGPDLSALARQASPAVGVVITFDVAGEPLTQGTVFFVRADGIGLTCHHVLSEAASALVRMENGAYFPVEGTLAADPARDLAVFKVAGKNIPTVPLGDSSSLLPGQRVVGITAPEGLENTIADGLVSAVRELPGGSVIQVTVPLSPGSSGGPIFDLEGRVVAIAAAGRTEGQALNFCVPIDDAKPLLAQPGQVTPLTPPGEPGNLDEWLRERPGSPSAVSASDLWLEGMDASLEGRYEEAVEHLTAALALDSSLYPAHCCLGNAYADLGRYQEAIAAFGQATRQAPDDAEAHYHLGWTYGKWGRYEEAIAAFEQAVRLKPDHAEAYYNLGVAFGKMGRQQEAIGAFGQAVRLKPDYAEAHYNLGWYWSKLGRYGEAIAAFGQAVRLKPDYAEAHYNLGVAYGEAGRHEEALVAFQQALRLEPNDAAAHFNLGWNYTMLDRYEEAIGAYQQGIRLEPNDAGAHYHLGVAYDELGRYEEATAAYEQSIRLEPENAGAHVSLGTDYGRLGRYQEAVAVFTQAIRLEPDRASAHAGLGATYFVLGDRARALEEYGILKDLDPDLADGLFDLLYPRGD